LTLYNTFSCPKIIMDRNKQNNNDKEVLAGVYSRHSGACNNDTAIVKLSGNSI